MAKKMDSISKVAVEAPKEAIKTEEPVVTPVETSKTSVTPGEPVATPAQEDTYERLFPEPTVSIDGPPQWVWWVLLVIGSVVLGLVAFRLVNSSYNNPVVATSETATPTAVITTTPSATPKPVATVTPSPTAVPTSTPTKSSITMRVLNGTTTPGLAATVRTTLQQAGFTVRTVGNASNQTYAASVIYYQTGHLADAQAVQTALSAYKPTLEESATAAPDNVLVVVGPH